MLQRVEHFGQRAMELVQFRVMVRLHPELERLESEHDRRWALRVANLERETQRDLGLFLCLLAGPAAGAVSGVIAGAAAGWVDAANWLLAFFSGWLMGGFMMMALIALRRRQRQRRRVLSAVRMYGHDICPACGYDMLGHAAPSRAPRMCPECGCDVPGVK